MKKVFLLMVLTLFTATLFSQTSTFDLSNDQLDQAQNTSSRRFYSGDNWQSFTAGTTGCLSIIRAYHYNTTESGSLIIYKGEGITKEVLHQQPYTANGTDFLYFPLSTTVPIQKGQKYTFRLTNFRWFFGKPNSYKDGRSDNGSNIDMLFQTYIRSNDQNCRMLGNITNAMLNNPKALGSQVTTAKIPSRRPGPGDKTWNYNDDKRMADLDEINSNGLGKCYNIKKIDLLNWSKGNLEQDRSIYVVKFYRDDSQRPARWNGKNYVIPKGVEYTATPNDRSELTTKCITSSQSFYNEVSNGFSASIGLPNVGSISAEATFKNVNQSNSSNYNMTAVTKQYKKLYKLDLEFDNPEYNHFIHPVFWEAVKRLGHDLSANDFIEQYGSHFAATAHFGGNFFQMRNVNQNQYAYSSMNESEFKIKVESEVKVKLGLGYEHGNKDKDSTSRSIKMTAKNTYTVGGDLTKNNPEDWAASVQINPAVVNGYLKRISDLFTTENFPEIPNIAKKKQLLEKAIILLEEETKNFRMAPDNIDFWNKKDAVFEIQITNLISKRNDSGIRNYFGIFGLGFWDGSNKLLAPPFSPLFSNMYAVDRDPLALDKNAPYMINKTYRVKVPGAQVENGYAAITGSFFAMNPGWLSPIKMPTYNHFSTQAQIPFINAFSSPSPGRVRWDSNDGNDAIEIHYIIRRIDNPRYPLNPAKRVKSTIIVDNLKAVSVSQSAIGAPNKIQISMTKPSSMRYVKAINIYDKKGALIKSLELKDEKTGPATITIDRSKFAGTVRIDFWKGKQWGINTLMHTEFFDTVDLLGKNTTFRWVKD